MDWKQFFSSIVGHLAWPAVVVYLLFLLRHQLEGLAERLEEVTLPGGASAKFRRQLAKATEEADKVGTEHQSKPPMHADEAPTAPTTATRRPEDDPFLKLAESFPEAAVVQAFKEIEVLLFQIASYLPENWRRGSQIIVQRLLDLNKITDNSYELFQSLRSARNAAAHAVRVGGITADEALDYHDKAEVLKRVLQRVLDSFRSER